MVKNRKGVRNESLRKVSVTKHSTTRQLSNFVFKQWRLISISIILVVISAVIYQGYLETRVTTPFNSFKLTSLIENKERFWGTYRANLYFGIRAKYPESPLFGLLWYYPEKVISGNIDIKHWCEQYSNLKKYGWVKHDGKNFGIQEIIDDSYLITNTFLKYFNDSLGLDWSSKVAINSLKRGNGNKTKISFIWYVTYDDSALDKLTLNANDELNIEGFTSNLGKFIFRIRMSSGSFLHKSSMTQTISVLDDFKDLIISNLHLMLNPDDGSREIILKRSSHSKKPNFVAVQLTCIVPCSINVIFQSGNYYETNPAIDPENALDSTLLNTLKTHIIKFDNEFESKFGLRKKGFNESEINFAEIILSQVLGGISYFYGASRVQSSYNKDPVFYWKAPLLTAIPSRSFFPRGFLWDEGFHGLLISSWDLDLELEIMAHWFDLMNSEGWIPREQILGNEALAKVPEEFVVQKNSNANPPTFFLTLKFILDHYKTELTQKFERFAVLDYLYPRLKKWFMWFNTTQSGPVSGSYQWRGRNSSTDRELNPKTLTSGLDDFPRASHPTPDERHIDLRCWIQFAAEVIVELSEFLQYDSDTELYKELINYLKNEEILTSLHWSSEMERFADYGLHTDDVVLKLVKHEQTKRKIIGDNPRLQLVDKTFGYVNLFPFFLHQIDPNSSKLSAILEQISDRNHLWTNFGLRSLSKSSPLYKKYNTNNDPPYWRGNIWINMNYLAIRALHYYGHKIGPSKNRALKLYEELKMNLVQNIFRQYKKTGFVWENYDDETGSGHGTKPFTGWTSLIVLIMADRY